MEKSLWAELLFWNFNCLEHDFQPLGQKTLVCRKMLPSVPPVFAKVFNILLIRIIGFEFAIYCQFSFISPQIHIPFPLSFPHNSFLYYFRCYFSMVHFSLSFSTHLFSTFYFFRVFPRLPFSFLSFYPCPFPHDFCIDYLHHSFLIYVHYHFFSQLPSFLESFSLS